MSNGPNYTQSDAENFVRLLGCWTFVDPNYAVFKRDPKDYHRLLCQLIENNKTRKDAIGRWETEAAKKALKSLGWEDGS